MSSKYFRQRCLRQDVLFYICARLPRYRLSIYLLRIFAWVFHSRWKEEVSFGVGYQLRRHYLECRMRHYRTEQRIHFLSLFQHRRLIIYPLLETASFHSFSTSFTFAPHASTSSFARTVISPPWYSPSITPSFSSIKPSRSR